MENEELKVNKMIDLLENGELPERIVKEGNKSIKKLSSLNDSIKFYKEFENMIPKVYFENETKGENANKKQKIQEKEIILSEQFI